MVTCIYFLLSNLVFRRVFLNTGEASSSVCSRLAKASSDGGTFKDSLLCRVLVGKAHIREAFMPRTAPASLQISRVTTLYPWGDYVM